MNTTNLFTLDTAIVAAYLLITLIIGLRAGRGITTMQDYVIGTSGVKTYGTPVLVATLFATEVGGGSTIGLSEKIFATGLIWLFAYLGVVLGLFLVAFFVAPHLGRFDFTGKLSVGEMMGGFYGTPGRVVTGIAGTIRSVATTGVQIAAMGYLFQYFFNMPSLCGILISCGIVVIYSSFGGIRSVTATDIVQFSVLVIIIPIIAARMLHHAGGWDTVCAGAPAGHFHLLSHKDLLKHAFTFFVLIIPNLDPAYIQRLLMARGDVKEAYNALISAGCLRAILICLVGITAFAVVASQPHLDPRHTYLYAVNTVLDTGYKGLGIAGLFAIIMSSADSYLHAAGVSFVHDVVQPLYKESLPSDQELKLTRFVTLLLGISAILGVLIFKSILDLALASLNLWLPVVIVPLLSGIVGYFSSTRTFCVAVTTGLTTVGLWKLGIEHYVPISSTIPAMVANLIAFVIARQFDHVGNIYFDPDDPLAQMAKVKMTKRAEQQAQTVARMSLAARVTHAARACLVVPVAGLLRFLWTRVTTFGWVHTSCEQREERYGIPSWKLILLSIAALGLSGFLEPSLDDGFGGALTGLRMFAGCLWLFLAFQELFTWSLLRQHGATWCFGALIVAWPFVTTFALLVHGDHWL
ncbi:MAG: sodium:solute symporter family protein, partial [Myxococcota bacterium]